VSWRGLEPPSEPITEERLRQLLAVDPAKGWRAFIDGYTPVLLTLIERAGIVDRDEVMEVYVQACERLAAHGYAALTRRDASIGSFAGWLAVIVRRAAVDWVRSRAGRRRMFAAIREMDRFHQRLFELFYWEGRRPAEAAEWLRVEMKQDVASTRSRASKTALSARHRSELISLAARSQAVVPLDVDDDTPGVDPPAPDLDPEGALRARERSDQLTRALAALPAEDAVIVSLKFVEGMTRAQIRRFLRLPELTEHRVRTIVATLRAQLTAAERGQHV